MSILSDDLINTTWDHDLLVALNLFKQRPNMTNLGYIRNIIKQNCAERNLKLMWSKHKYIGIDKDTPSLVIAGCENPDSCYAEVFHRLQGNSWTYDMKWTSLPRPEIPLSQGPHWASFEKFILPEEVFCMLRKQI